MQEPDGEPSARIECPACGSLLNTLGAKFCSECGEPLATRRRRYARQDSAREPEPPRRSSAFAGGFFGCFGVLAAILIVLVILLILAGVALTRDPETRPLITGDASDVMVEVRGDVSGFQGSIGSGFTQRSVQGTAPATFVLSGRDSSGIFIAVISKTGEGGVLTVSLRGCPDGQRHEQSTSAAYGLVSVSC